MTARKKKPSLDMPFEEALARFISTDPKELEDEIAKVKADAEETERYVEERRQSIKRGARRAPKRFRL